MEPNVSRVYGKALLVKSTSIACPKALIEHLTLKLKKHNVDIMLNTDLVDLIPNRRIIKCVNKKIEYGYFINCAGAYAEKNI